MAPFLLQTFRWSQNHFGAELYNLESKNDFLRVSQLLMSGMRSSSLFELSVDFGLSN